LSKKLTEVKYKTIGMAH